MGLFSRTSATDTFPWTPLTSVAQLEEILGTPSGKAKLFFKHSTRCSISSMALRSFEREWKTEDDRFELYFLDLIAHRDVSGAIAEETGIIHQSPQVVVVKDGEVIYDASHHSIDAETIAKL